MTDGDEGYLVPARDEEAFATAAGRLLDDPELAHRMGEAGRERARRYDWGIVADELEAIYREAAPGR